jgi:hypothetical protein
VTCSLTDLQNGQNMLLKANALLLAALIITNPSPAPVVDASSHTTASVAVKSALGWVGNTPTSYSKNEVAMVVIDQQGNYIAFTRM